MRGEGQTLLPAPQLRRACIIKLLLHLPQNIQILGQYLKFGDIYAFVKSTACSSVTLQNMFSIWLLKLIFLSNVTLIKWIGFEELIVFSAKDISLSIFSFNISCSKHKLKLSKVCNHLVIFEPMEFYIAIHF